jgi:solute carrier family 45, member 1/2/4
LNVKVVLGISSFLIAPMCQKLTAMVVWVISCVMVCIVMALVTILSAWSLGDIGGSVQDNATEKGLRGAALALFVFGFPFALSKQFCHCCSMHGSLC